MNSIGFMVYTVILPIIRKLDYICIYKSIWIYRYTESSYCFHSNNCIVDVNGTNSLELNTILMTCPAEI